MSEINAESTTMPPVELRMPRASEREEMLAGKLYNSVDPELNALREKAGDLCARFNAASRTDHAARAAILDELLPKWEEMGYSFGSLDQLASKSA